MVPPGGIEPRTFHPALRTGLEDRCRDRGQNLVLSILFQMCLALDLQS